VRRTLIAGNWKMNLNRAEAISLAKAIVAGASQVAADVDLLVCPPAVYLEAVHNVVGEKVALGAQNVYCEANGAFTGEISTNMLIDLGCRYVILGHSERRHLIGETDALVNRKVAAALSAGLTPILCVGEMLADREADQTEQVVSDQLNGSLAGLTADQMQNVVIAYEPVWAIGTGRTATPEQAQHAHFQIRQWLAKRFSQLVADKIQILYGGSAKPENVSSLLSQPDIDGGLIGGASLKADSFLSIAGAVGVGIS
jgi:triosephosphate isomerase